MILTISQYWNQGAIDNLVEYFSSITCDTFKIGLRQIDSSLYDCTFFTSDPAKLVIEGGFDDRDVPANTQLSININGFRNPIQANTDFNVFNIYSTGQSEKDIVD